MLIKKNLCSSIKVCPNMECVNNNTFADFEVNLVYTYYTVQGTDLYFSL